MMDVPSRGKNDIEITPMKATHVMVLKDIAERRGVDIRKVSEPYRQRIIDLGMMEPPLVQIDADRVSLTADGRSALKQH